MAQHRLSIALALGAGALALGELLWVLIACAESYRARLAFDSVVAAACAFVCSVLLAKRLRINVWKLALLVQAILFGLAVSEPKTSPQALRAMQSAPYFTLLRHMERGEATAREALIARGISQAASSAELLAWCAKQGGPTHLQKSLAIACRIVATGCSEDIEEDKAPLQRLCGLYRLDRGRIQSGEKLLVDAAGKGDLFALPLLIANREARGLGAPRQARYVPDSLSAPWIYGLRATKAPGTLSITPAQTPGGVAVWLSGKDAPRMQSRRLPASWAHARLWLRFGPNEGAVIYRDGERIIDVWDCKRLPDFVCRAAAQGRDSEPRGGWVELELKERGGYFELVGPLLFGGIEAGTLDG